MFVIANILPIVQIVIAAVLVTVILLQQMGEGGLGSAFGGGGTSYHTKRGFEKILFTATVVFAVLFSLSTILALLIQ